MSPAGHESLIERDMSPAGHEWDMSPAGHESLIVLSQFG